MTTRLQLGPDAVAEVEQFIFAMVKWGEHDHTVPRSWSFEQMRASIPGYVQLLEEVRQGRPVKHFENLVGATWHTEGSVGAAGGISVRNPVTREERTLTGDGVIDWSSYVATFETAVAAWYRSIERQSLAELRSALRDGIASVEGFINQRAAEWSTAHPEDELTEKHRFVPFRTKLDSWCQKMTGNRMEPENMERLLHIKQRRDAAVHPKHSVSAVSLEELADLLNEFTFAIAVPFFDLHRMFSFAVPAIILRAAYAPIVNVE